MKAKIIEAFAGDGILLQVAVFDERNEAYLLEDNGIKNAKFVVSKLEIDEAGEMSGNVVSFRIASDKTTAGNYPYFVLLEGEQIRLTVAFGTLQVMSLPE